MSKIKLAIIFGGKSSEYGISLHSTSSAIENMDLDLYELIFIGISKEGKWYYYPGDVEGIEKDTWMQHPGLCDVILSSSESFPGFIKLNKEHTYELIKVDCLFPIIHGKNGEDGTLQGLFTLANIPYVGCDHICSAISMDKDYTHIICEAANIRMAPYICVRKRDDFDYKEAFKQAQEKLTLPLFLKPANAGSSFGISKVNNYEEFEKGLKFAFQHDRKVLLETSIENSFEVGCAVLGNDTLKMGKLDEIETGNDFFDYDAKYALENTQIICPARISKEVENRIKEIAKKIYRVLDCSGLARIDFFVQGDEILFNELNTIPGFTKASRYPTMMKKTGIDFKTLINELVTLAMSK